MFSAIRSNLVAPSALSLALLFLSWAMPADSQAAKVRVKDICWFQDKQEVDLIGYGLIIGLDGTGDGTGVQFTAQSMSNMIERMGLTVNPKKLKVKNVAAVMVTARMSSQQTVGSYFDVTVSSIGDASSLQGGTLLLTLLSDPDGVVRASAQGPVSIGGFNVQVDDANKIVNNYTLVGRVPGGGKVTHQLKALPESDRNIYLSLYDPDITTSDRIAQAINIKYGLAAYPVDAGSVKIVIPDSLMYPTLRSRFISDIGHLMVLPDAPARVVINEKTGTIVAGSHVTIAPVAIAHGTITVNIQSTPIISQPEPFSDGETIVTQQPNISVDHQQARVVNLKESVYLSQVAEALNRIGATPRDIIAIFQAMKQAGALRAELIIL